MEVLNFIPNSEISLKPECECPVYVRRTQDIHARMQCPLHSVLKKPNENETNNPNLKSTLEPGSQNYILNSKISLEKREKSKKTSVLEKHKKIVVWCGNCDGCLKEHDCGTCKHCQNKKLRQKCVFRFCDWQLESSANKKVRQEKFILKYHLNDNSL